MPLSSPSPHKRQTLKTQEPGVDPGGGGLKGWLTTPHFGSFFLKLN